MKTAFIGFRTTQEVSQDIEVLRKLSKQNKNQWIEQACLEKIELDKWKLQKLAPVMNKLKVKQSKQKEMATGEIKDIKDLPQTGKIDVAAIVRNHKPKEKQQVRTHFGATK